MIFDDPLADGEAQAGAVRFSVGRERLKKAGRDLGREAGTAVFDFGDDLAVCGVKADDDFSSLRHEVHGVVHEVKKHVGEPGLVHAQRRLGRLVFTFDAHRALRSFGADVGECLPHKLAVAAGDERAGAG